MRLLAALLLLPVAASAQFEILDAHTTASLRGIDAVSPRVAWASGSGGTVLLTTDGGANWKHCAAPPGGEKLDFRGVQAFDAQTAFVMASGKGPLSAIFKTTDACATWKLVFADPDADGFFDAISFHRSNDGKVEGWVLGDPVDGRYRVFRSRDGIGFMADETPTLAAPSAQAGAFAASNSSLFVLWDGPTMPGILLPPPPAGTVRKDNRETIKTTVEWFVTGGVGGARVYLRQPEFRFDMQLPTEWKSQPIPLGSGTEPSGAFAIAVRDADSGVIVGGDYAKPEIADRTCVYRDPESHDWRASATMPSGYRSGVAFDAAAKTWIAVGPNGTDISRDDGKNWTPLKPGPGDAADADQHWNAISLPFVVGSKGKIGKLTPGKAYTTR